METGSFEGYALGLLAVFETLPIPIAISLDHECTRVEGNQAFRKLTGLTTPQQLHMLRAAREGVEVVADGVSAWPLRDSSGLVQGGIGVFVDVMHSLHASERRYRRMIDAMPQFVWLDAANGSTIYSNRRWLEYTGLHEQDLARIGWRSVVHPDDINGLEAQRDVALHALQPYERECRYRGKDGKYRWFLFGSIPVPDEDGPIITWLCTATDIDKQKRAEAQQAFLALIGDVLGSTLDVSTTLERIARLAIPSLGTWCQIDIPDASGRLRVAFVAHEDAAKETMLRQLVNRHIYNGNAELGPPGVLTSLKPQLLSHVSEKAVQSVIPAAADRSIYASVGYSAGVIVPLRIRDRVLGVLGIASDDSTRLYTRFDVATAVELGRRGAIALENAQSFAREHRAATTLQRALLPVTLPQSALVQFDAAYTSAASGQGEAVGGDWYDAFALDDRRIAISMGDVTGHGLDAAVTMSVVRQAIRAAALDHRSTSKVLVRANATLMLEQRAPMVTALFGVYNVQTRELFYSIAGHPRPLLVDDAGTLIELSAAGTPLGEIFESASLEEQTLRIGPRAAALVLYTDGLIEAERDIVGALKRVNAAVCSPLFFSSEEPAQALIESVLEGRQIDDVAVLVMRVAQTVIS
jgi:PAS domain S-box-containing protein